MTIKIVNKQYKVYVFNEKKHKWVFYIPQNYLRNAKRIMKSFIAEGKRAKITECWEEQIERLLIK